MALDRLVGALLRQIALLIESRPEESTQHAVEVAKLAMTLAEAKQGRAQSYLPVENPETLATAEAGQGQAERKRHLAGWMGCELCARVLGHFNGRCGSRFRGAGPYMANVHSRHIEFGVEICIAVIDLKASQWESDPQMRQHLAPETIFRPSLFEKYVNQLPVALPLQTYKTPSADKVIKNLWESVDGRPEKAR